jgi:hypothetical protein
MFSIPAITVGREALQEIMQPPRWHRPIGSSPYRSSVRVVDMYGKTPSFHPGSHFNIGYMTGHLLVRRNLKGVF